MIDYLAVINFIFRWAHVLFGIVWIGMLYYFNFVQTEYFKEAEAGAKSDAMQKLAPRALWWFRWGAMLTFITGLYLLYTIGAHNNLMVHSVIWIGAAAGILMFLNVWLIIWPNQQIVLGMKGGDGPTAAAKAGLASRTNTLLSGPMLFGMLGSFTNGHLHLPLVDGNGEVLRLTGEALGANGELLSVSPTALWICLGVIALLEINAIFGRLGPLASVRGVIHCSLALTAALWLVLACV